MPHITSTFAPAPAAVPGAIVGQPAARPVRLLSATLPRGTPSGAPEVARPPAPLLPSSECSPLERELAVGNAGLPARASQRDKRAAAQRPGAGFLSLRIDPLSHEAAAPVQNAAFESSRLDPLNREPEATLAPDAVLNLPVLIP
jgi:hypothetical protein